MHLDVVQLRKFYYRSTLGRAVQKVIRDELVRLWPPMRGETIAGFGFAAPLLRPYLQDARRVMALMPGPQGVMQWPFGLPNVSVLCEETAWPIETGRVDRLVMLHGLETSAAPEAILAEAWRVLGPGGRLMVIVPARAGLWSRSDATPFGFGRPYSTQQLDGQLRCFGFTPQRVSPVLHQPPLQGRFWLRAGPMIERMGRKAARLAPAGVLMIEATKLQPQGGTPLRAAQRVISVLAPKPTTAAL